jgi:hypothetical protein
LIEGISISLALITVTSQNVASSTVCGTVSASVIAFIVLTVWAQSDVNIGTQSSSSVEELLGWVWVADAWVTFLIERVCALVALTRDIHAASAVLNTKWAVVPTIVVLTSWALSKIHASSSVVVGPDVDELGDQTLAGFCCGV